MKTSNHSPFPLAAALTIALGLLLASSFAAHAQFQFEKGDKVVLIGNSLADRMQHDGWMETLLQSELPDHKLVFRNHGFTGDTVTKRPRSKDFTSPEDYLKISKADVIFVFFGYNESFQGDKGIDAFKKDLAKMVDDYRALKPNGKSDPRIVLFTPIAHEDLKDPNLPDGKENNKNLAAYSKAIEAVATDKKTGFVDLFQSTSALYEKIDNPLTINGIHLNEEGNHELAKVIVKSLLDREAKEGKELQALRDAVLDKNLQWYNRYRATDGNDVWGSRSTLKFVGEQTNADVLQHELIMYDVLTANRDARIHALAKGDDLVVDDSNLPKPVAVVSNVGGKGKMSNADKEGTLKYLSGQEGVEKITVPDGFEVQLFADQEQFPALVNPVQMQVDGKGRLWAAVWPTYPKPAPGEKLYDSLLIFEDTDGDGKADKSKEFAKIANPLGFEFWNGGVIVASQPDFWFLRDTDGDDVADERYVIMQGVGSADTHHAANNLIMGPDGGIYWQSGIFLHNNIEHPWGPSLSTGASAQYRFDPRRYTITFHGNNSPNPHGISFDRWGYHYATDGTGGRAYQVVPKGDSWAMNPLLTKQVRPVPAHEVVSSDNFPEDMQQDFFIANAIGYLGIKHYDLNRDGGATRKITTGRGKNAKTTESTTKLGEVWGTPSKTNDFLQSADKNFRPTDIIFGADGALYVSDWQNVIIGHMQHNIRDPNRDHQHGRIFRVVHKNRPLQKPVKIDGATLPELMANLEHPVNGVRHRTRIELSERPTKDVIAACQEWMKKFDPKKKEDAHALLEALWVHQQHNVRDSKLLGQLLTSPEPHARIAANTVQHHWYNVDYTNKSGRSYEIHTETNLPKGIISDTDELTVVQINTVVEKMRYDVKDFTVKAGKNVKLTFTNPDFMPHNLIITQPKSGEEVALAALAMGAEGFAKGFLPESPKILWATKMLDNGQSEVLEFQAPDKPGDYEFVCTFPGHYMLMRGIMKVVK